MVNYNHQNIVIVGAGETGRACFDYFYRKGAKEIKIMDTRVSPPQQQHFPMQIPRHFGGLSLPWLLAADLIVLSPGVALTQPEIIAAQQANKKIVGDIGLFLQENHAPIIAITGSNGKSTVTEWVGAMAQAAEWKAGVGGNIGIPALQLLQHRYQLIVLELSSFQLETINQLGAKAATILNIVPDHADRYPLGFASYQAAKQRIYQQAQNLIINAEDPLTWPVESDAKQQQCYFGLQQGTYHTIFDNQGKRWLAKNSDPIVDTTTMKLAGAHNYLNALAAFALAEEANIPREAIIKALQTFPGLPHRFQIVHQQHGVTWINDSKATNVGSTVAALQSLSVVGTLHLLLGGDSKGADFSPLLPLLMLQSMRLYCFGRDGTLLSQLSPAISANYKTLSQAVTAIRSKLQAGDVVLLSPGCASWDQFKNFAARGDAFSLLARGIDTPCCH